MMSVDVLHNTPRDINLMAITEWVPPQDRVTEQSWNRGTVLRKTPQAFEKE